MLDLLNAVNIFLQKSTTINVQLCSKNAYVACKEKKKYLIRFYIILYNFINCPVFIDIKQTLHYKQGLIQSMFLVAADK